MGERKRAEKSASHFIFHVRAFKFKREYQIYKLPLFVKPSTDSSPAISLKRCTTKAPPPEFSLTNRPSIHRFRPYYSGRFNRHYQFCKTQIRKKKFLNTPMPKPYIEFKCTGIGPGVLPEETAIAAVGSKIYLMGGCIWTAGDWVCPRKGMVLPTHVHMIDAASPEIVKTSSELNSGKRSPVAWTVGGKIYLMPKTFVAREPPGDFECLDPASGSWTVLPSPPFVNDISKFTIKARAVYSPNNPLLLIKNNTVSGSSIIIVTHAGDIYSFDTTHPDKGWTSVTVLCGSSQMCDSEKLNFLPFDGTTSIPVGDNLILSHCSDDSFPAPDFRCVTHFLHRNRDWTVDPYTSPGVAEKMFLETRCGVLNGDAYACRLIAKVDSDSSTMLSLHVKRVELPIRWEELVCSGPFYNWENIVRIGDGLVLITKAGGRKRSCSHHCSLNVVRIENKAGSDSDEPVFAILSSVLLIPMGVLPDHVCSFLLKDGNFTTGF